MKQKRKYFYIAHCCVDSHEKNAKGNYPNRCDDIHFVFTENSEKEAYKIAKRHLKNSFPTLSFVDYVKRISEEDFYKSIDLYINNLDANYTYWDKL